MKTILILCPYFAPAYKGGGPIQSLVNMLTILPENVSNYVVCSSMDLGDSTGLPGIEIDQWNGFNANTKVFYIGSHLVWRLQSTFNSVNPDLVYINGMFSMSFNFAPLLLAKVRRKLIVISPRGMLQEGALAVKPFKKKLFLLMFKMLRLHKGIRWHATDQQEETDIKRAFGYNSKVLVAGNVPRAGKEMPKRMAKVVGKLRMAYFSLITEKKGLLLALEALALVETPIVFHMYGPVKDQEYWKKCEQLMNSLKHEVLYLGSVQPSVVPVKLAAYDVMILPTKGENFGHAIYESLSVGTPVILGKHTPWGNLQEHMAGITVEVTSRFELAKAIAEFVALDDDQYSKISNGAYDLAGQYLRDGNFREEYARLFSN